MKKILVTLFMSVMCISMYAQLSDSRLHYYVNRDQKQSNFIVWFNGRTVHFATFPPQDRNMTESELKDRFRSQPNGATCTTLTYNPSLSTNDRTVYSKDGHTYAYETGGTFTDTWGNTSPRYGYKDDGRIYFSVSNDKTEIIYTKDFPSDRGIRKFYLVEVNRSYIEGGSRTPINKDFINE